VRTAYLGTSAFAADILRALAESPHRPSLVVTRPDRPRGRGRRLAAPPVAEAARELGLDLAQPEQVNDPAAREQIAAVRPEAVIVCAFGALIREPLLSEHEMLNVHPSLLPRWRGAAPIERAIMAGDEVTGVSIMRLTEGLDSGPVCAQATTPIGLEDTYGTLSAQLASLGAQLLLEVLDTRPACAEQPLDGVVYAEKIAPEDRVLDPRHPAAELERVVRALHPHIGAAVLLPDGERLGVRAARVVPSAGPDPGVFDLEGPRPLLGCGEGALELLEVQPAGRRPMSGEDFLRGRQGRG
jgi:methionyl-tRNA formyltransferase